jgi:hypothetical protein
MSVCFGHERQLTQEEDTPMTGISLTSSAGGDPPRFAVGIPRSQPVKDGEIEIAGRRYVTADRLAAMLGITVRTLSRWHAARVGPPKITIGKTVLFDLGKLPDWLASREAQPLTRNTSH